MDVQVHRRADRWTEQTVLKAICLLPVLKAMSPFLWVRDIKIKHHFEP